MTNLHERAQKWIDNDATDPYSGGFTGRLIQDLDDALSAANGRNNEIARKYGIAYAAQIKAEGQVDRLMEALRSSPCGPCLRAQDGLARCDGACDEWLKILQRTYENAVYANDPTILDIINPRPPAMKEGQP